MIMTNKLMSRM